MDPASINMTLNTLAEKISGLEIHVHSRDVYFYSYHTRCFASDIKKEVAVVIANIEDPVLESHYRHMATQKAKLS